MLKKLLCVTSLFLLTGCAKILTAEQTAPEINVETNKKELSFAILDKREYVVSKDKKASFEGLRRSTVGIPYSQSTLTNEAMSVYLTNRLNIGFKNRGIKSNSVNTNPEMTITDVISSVTNSGKTSIVFILNEWKYDYHSFSDNSWYDVDVIILNNQGQQKLAKNFKGENDVPSGDLISNEMQLIYKQRFEEIFSDKEVLKALKF